MADTQPGFTLINTAVCTYCTHRMVGEHDRGSNDGCGLRQNPAGNYARIVSSYEDDLEQLKGRGIDAVDDVVGCDRLEPTGLPAHPLPLERMVRRNPRCSTIPSDPRAIETAQDFGNKANTYLRRVAPQNFIDYTKIQ